MYKEMFHPQHNYLHAISNIIMCDVEIHGVILLVCKIAISQWKCLHSSIPAALKSLAYAACWFLRSKIVSLLLASRVWHCYLIYILTFNVREKVIFMGALKVGNDEFVNIIYCVGTNCNLRMHCLTSADF